jgi:hypothetical protein
MGWYKNQKPRHEAHKAGPPRPLTDGLGDKPAAGMEHGGEKLEATHERLETETVAMQDAADAKKGAKKARKRERKLARRGTAGPS